MKYFFPILVIFLLQACSSTSEDNEEVVNYEINNSKISQQGAVTDSEIENEFRELKNSDFILPKQITTPANADYYPNSLQGGPIAGETLDVADNGLMNEIVSSDSALVKAVALCYQKQVEAGLQKLDELYLRYQKNATYWNQMGTCHLLKNQYRKALLYYNKARDLDNKYAPAINNIGVIFFRQSRFQKALDAFKKARELRPFSKTPAFNLAHLYLRFGIPTLAKPLFISLQADHPADDEITGGLAVTHLMQGELEEALALFEAVEAKSTLRPWIGINYSLALKMNGQSEKSIQVYKRVNSGNLGPLSSYYERVGKYLGSSQMEILQ